MSMGVARGLGPAAYFVNSPVAVISGTPFSIHGLRSAQIARQEYIWNCMIMSQHWIVIIALNAKAVSTLNNNTSTADKFNRVGISCHNIV
jgi:hypothetical protein